MFVAIFLAGCVSIGPRRLQKDCTWVNRKDTKTETAILSVAIAGTIGGFVTFIAGFLSRNNTVTGIGLATAGASIPLGWWSGGALEQVGLANGRLRKCRRKRAEAK